MKLLTHPGLVLSGLALGLALSTSVPSARANVYATNIKLNGGMTNLSVAQGASVALSYILNEPATAGVTIQILSGNTPVRTLSLTNGAPGTARGLNTNVLWDGKDGSGQTVPAGSYSVSITAAASGYSAWTRITADDNSGNYTWEARGIAVDRNTNSPYYGRVFVGNSFDHTPSAFLGDRLGIQKLNADGSYADEGGFSDGGVAWRGGYQAPWKLRVSDDDNVYVGDLADAGDVYRFDGTLSSNSMLHVFAPPANRSLGLWTGFCLTGRGTNTTLWGADGNYPGSGGIKKFALQPDGTFDPAAGTQVVAVGGSPGLNLSPFAVSLDSAGAIYTLQSRLDQGDASAFVLRFPAYDPSTNAGTAETTADWVKGPGDDYVGGQGVAVDPTGTYLAACFWGYPDLLFGAYTNGNVKIFYATNGMVVTNLDLGIALTNSLVTDWTTHLDSECDWDAVGNLYYLDDVPGCWRAFSPPGANQATTKALPLIQIGAPTGPQITSIELSGTNVIVYFTGSPSDLPSAFALLSCTNVSGLYSVVSGAVITGSGGNFQAVAATNGVAQFYDVQRLSAAPQAPLILDLKISAGTVTVRFTGDASDPASAFTLLRSDTVKGAYASATTAVITGSNGLYQATVPTNGPAQFYRLQR